MLLGAVKKLAKRIYGIIILCQMQVKEMHRISGLNCNNDIGKLRLYIFACNSIRRYMCSQFFVFKNGLFSSK